MRWVKHIGTLIIKKRAWKNIIIINAHWWNQQNQTLGKGACWLSRGRERTARCVAGATGVHSSRCWKKKERGKKIHFTKRQLLSRPPPPLFPLFSLLFHCCFSRRSDAEFWPPARVAGPAGEWPTKAKDNKQPLLIGLYVLLYFVVLFPWNKKINN